MSEQEIELRRALKIAALALEIAADWNLTNVNVNPPKEWGLKAFGEDEKEGWCSTQLLADKLRKLAEQEPP